MKPVEPEVVIGEQALERLVERVHHPALVVMDANTEEAAGARVLGELREAGVDARAFVFPERSGLLATPETVQRVRNRLSSGRLPVAVGAGVITDVVRYAAHECGSDFISVPTAASMDGYASGVAALEHGGVKITLPARAPLGIYADPAVAAAAPTELSRAGLGDLLGKATARVDWLAAHRLYGELYLPEVADLVLEPMAFAATHVEAVLHGEKEAMQELLAGLVRSGTAIARAGSSRPASGSEHHASHFWDLLAARGLRPHRLHGLQVGYATTFATALQRFAFGGGVEFLRRPVASAEPLGADARRWLGEPSEEIVAAVAEKQRFAAELSRWPQSQEEWKAAQVRIAPALELHDSVRPALEQAGIPSGPGFLDVDRSMLRATFRYAGRLRARYTVLDFLEGQGLLGEAIDFALA